MRAQVSVYGIAEVAISLLVPWVHFGAAGLCVAQFFLVRSENVNNQNNNDLHLPNTYCVPGLVPKALWMILFNPVSTLNGGPGLPFAVEHITGLHKQLFWPGFCCPAYSDLGLPSGFTSHRPPLAVLRQTGLLASFPLPIPFPERASLPGQLPFPQLPLYFYWPWLMLFLLPRISLFLSAW